MSDSEKLFLFSGLKMENDSLKNINLNINEKNILKDKLNNTYYKMSNQDQKDLMTFSDVVSLKGAKFISSLSKEECKVKFWDRTEVDQDGENKYNWNTYYGLIKKFAFRIKNFKGDKNITQDENNEDKLYIKQEYKYAKGKKDGRIYVKGFGVQSLQNGLRKILTGDYMKDIDIKNAHPTILLEICRRFKKFNKEDEDKTISFKYLKTYVEKREEILASGVDKMSMLIALNCDNASTNKREKNAVYVGNNEFLREFHKEKQTNYEMILNDKAFMADLLSNYECDLDSTTNTKNPISSKMNFIFCMRENKLIQQSIQSERIVPMFDGFMFDETEYDYTPEVITTPTGYTWTFKSNKSEDDDYLDWEDEEDGNSYEALKEKFEESHVKICVPPSYICRYPDEEGNMTNNWISPTQMKEYGRNLAGYPKIEEMKPDGTPCMTRFIDKWLDDPECRQYSRAIFCPHGEKEEDPTPEGMFNLFNGFTYKISEEITELVKEKLQYEKLQNNTLKNKFINWVRSLKNIDDQFYRIPKDLSDDAYTDYKNIMPYLHFLKYGLGNNDKKTFDYIKKWYSHKVQKPSTLTRTSLCLKGSTGVGKDKQIDILEDIIGSEYVYRTADLTDVFPKSDNGGFNACIAEKLLVAFNESGGKNVAESIELLKDQVDRKRNNIKRKYMDTMKQKNYIDIHQQSNQDSCVVVQWNERRQVLVVVGDYKKGNKTFWTKFCNWLEKGGHECIYNYFMSLDLSEFSPERDRVITEAYEVLRNNNIPPHILWLNNQLKDEMPIFENKKGNYFLEASEIYSHFKEWANSNNMLPQNWNSKAMKTQLLNMGIVKGGVKGWSSEIRIKDDEGQIHRRRGVMILGDVLKENIKKYNIQELGKEDAEDWTDTTQSKCMLVDSDTDELDL